MPREGLLTPFTTFNFEVKLTLPSTGLICQAEFSDCDGLEMTMEPKTIREGGNNNRQIHLAGPVSYGQLTLKRGMTSDYGLWNWFEQVQFDRGLRADGEVSMLASDRSRVDVRFELARCLPIKVKAPALAAKDGQIAIEELTLLYETMMLLGSGEG